MISEDFERHVLLRPRQDFSISTFNHILLALDSAGYEYEVVHLRREPTKKDFPGVAYYDLGIRVKVPYNMYTLEYEKIGRAFIKSICDYTDCTENQIKIVSGVRWR